MSISTPDGSLDPSFTLPPMAVSRGVEGLLLQSDGKILIGGDFSNIGATTALTMARLNADGTLDPTFGSGVPLGSYGGRVITIVRQPDGSLLAAGGFFIDLGGTRLSHLVRLDPDGIPDLATVSITVEAPGFLIAATGQPLPGAPESSPASLVRRGSPAGRPRSRHWARTASRGSMPAIDSCRAIRACR